MVKDHRYCTGAFKAQILIPHKATIDFACNFGPRKQIKKQGWTSSRARMLPAILASQERMHTVAPKSMCPNSAASQQKYEKNLLSLSI